MFRILSLAGLLLYASLLSAQFGEGHTITDYPLNNYENQFTVDIDSDGDLDIAIRSEDDRLRWLENDGTGSFSNLHSPYFYETPYLRSKADFQDLNGDGYIDLVCRGNNAAHADLVIYWNDGTGNFPTNSTLVVDLSYYDQFTLFFAAYNRVFEMEIIDFDGDGDLDITYIHSFEWVSGSIVTDYEVPMWHENLGSGQFESHMMVGQDWPYNLKDLYSDYLGDAYTLDLDGDGLLDYCISTDDYKVLWHKNLGDQLFEPGQIQAVDLGSYHIYNLDPIDLDSDGDLDLYLSFGDINGDKVWLENTSNGLDSVLTFAYVDPLPSPSYFVHGLFDFDLDGDRDIFWSNNNFGNTISYSENLGNLVFASEEVNTGLYLDYGYSIGDIDGDGDFDFVNKGSNSSVRLCSQAPDSTFTCAVVFEADLQNPMSLDAADFDGDGDNDLVTSSRNDPRLAIWKNQGDGSFEDKQHIGPSQGTAQSADFSTYFPTSVICTDLDLDGDQDILFSSSEDDKLLWHTNDGEANFTMVLIEELDHDIGDMKIGDLNGDSYMDIVYRDVGIGNLHLVLSQGNGLFAPSTLLDEAQDQGGSVELGDADNDGDLDIFYSNLNVQLSLMLNDGTGQFAIALTDICPSLSNAYLELGDVDGDGWIDIATSGFSGDDVDMRLHVWFNDGNLNFIDSGAEIANTFAVDPKLSDVDLDGDLDFVISRNLFNGGTGTAQWLENDGLGNFPSTSYISYVSSSHINRILIKDMDGDLRKDIVYIDSVDDEMVWVENLFGTPGVIEVFTFEDLNENGIMDPEDSEFNDLGITCSPAANSAYYPLAGGILYALSPGNYELTPDIDDVFWTFTSPNSSIDVTVTEDGTDPTIAYFGYAPNTEVIEAVQGSIIHSQPVCNSATSLWARVRNEGNTHPSGYASVQIDPMLVIIDALDADSINGNTVYYSYNEIDFYSSQGIIINTQMPDESFTGETFTSSIHVFDNNGLLVSENMVTEMVLCAYDPNDMTEMTSWQAQAYHDYKINLSESKLEYRIRFQNTGNFPATDIMVQSILPPELDANTLQIISTSHEQELEVVNGNILRFNFNEIMLADSVSDEANSHGYILFEINMTEGLMAPNEIITQANIFFDQNEPVITNFEKVRIFDCSNLAHIDHVNETLPCEGVNEFLFIGTHEYAQDYFWTLDSTEVGTNDSLLATNLPVGSSYFELTTSNPLCSDIYDYTISISPTPTAEISAEGNELTCISPDAITYQWFLNGVLLEGATSNQVTLNEEGIVTVEVTNMQGCIGTSDPYNHLQDGIQELSEIGVTISPNPADSWFEISGLNILSASRIVVLDVAGSEIHAKLLTSDRTLIDCRSWSAGNYTLIVYRADERIIGSTVLVKQ